MTKTRNRPVTDYLPWIFLAVSFLIRLVYLLESRENPYFAFPIIDEKYHMDWARSLATGDWVGKEAFFRAPFYPYFLGGLVAIFGERFFWLRFAHVILGTVNCGLIYLIARDVKGEVAARIALLLVSFYWVFVYYDAQLLIVTTFTFWVLLSLLLIFRAGETLVSKRWFAAGICMGMASITRPNILIFVPVAIYLIARVIRKNESLPRLRLHASLLLLLGVLIPTITVTVRNYAVSKDFVWIASQGGINFYIGNNRNSDGWGAVVPEIGPTWQNSDIERIAVHGEGRELKPSEVSGYWFRRGFQDIITFPAYTIKLYLKKVVLFWNHREIKNNVDLNYLRRYSSVTRYNPVGFYLLGPLAFLGIYLSRPFRTKDIVLLLFILSYMVSVVLFFVCARYRVPVTAVLVVYSGYAVEKVIALVKRRKIGELGMALPALLVPAIVINVDFYGDVKDNFAQEHYNIGTTYIQKEDYTGAMKEFREAVSLFPEYADAYNNMGYIHEKRADAFNRQGRRRQSRSEYDSAEAMYRKSISLKEDFLLARGNLANVYVKTGRRRVAIELFGETFSLVPDYLPDYAAYILRMLGTWLYEEGDYGEAMKHLRKSLRINPRSRETAEYLARTKEALKRSNE